MSSPINHKLSLNLPASPGFPYLLEFSRILAVCPANNKNAKPLKGFTKAAEKSVQAYNWRPSPSIRPYLGPSRLPCRRISGNDLMSSFA
jgi:hypothetical protein